MKEFLLRISSRVSSLGCLKTGLLAQTTIAGLISPLQLQLQSEA
jgi:hypothetical protein